jgi:hypothetical protein
MYWGVVEFIIQDGPPPILDSILDRCDNQDENQRYRAEAGIRCSKNGKYL